VAFSPLVKQLIDSLQVLPGVGPKSAQRMALHLLTRNREGGQRLSQVLAQAMKQVGHCEHCRILCENRICFICENKNRDSNLLCIVEGPAHVASIEQTGGFQGYYFVLTGHLSPIDGIGPKEIGIEDLSRRLTSEGVKEVILATNSTVEGEATAYYIADLVKAKGLVATRIAHGVPLGGELDYVDGQTIAKAMADRYHMND
jgi:recombination protein RecR